MAPVGKEVAQPDVFAAGDQRLRKVWNLVEHEEPVLARDLRVHFTRHNAGWHVVHDDEAIDALGMVLDQPGGDARTSIMTDESNPFDVEFLEQFDDVIGHRPLVIAARGLVGLAVAAKIRSDDAVAGGQSRDLETPGKAGFRKAVQQDDRWADSGLEVELSDAVCPACRAANFGHDLISRANKGGKFAQLVLGAIGDFGGGLYDCVATGAAVCQLQRRTACSTLEIGKKSKISGLLRASVFGTMRD